MTLYQVKGELVYRWITEEECWACGHIREKEHEDKEVVTYRVEAGDPVRAKIAAKAEWHAKWREDHQDDDDYAYLRHFDWKWCDAVPLGEDVLLRESGAPILPGLTNER